MDRISVLVGLLTAFVPAAVAQDRFVPPSAIPEEVAHTALLFVVREAPFPHWDRATSSSWLEARGFRGDEVTQIIQRATRFHADYRVLEEALRRLDRENAGNLHSPSVQAERQTLRAQMTATVAVAVSDIRKMLPAPSRLRLDGLIAEVKSGIQMKAK